MITEDEGRVLFCTNRFCVVIGADSAVDWLENTDNDDKLSRFRPMLPITQENGYEDAYRWHELAIEMLRVILKQREELAEVANLP